MKKRLVLCILLIMIVGAGIVFAQFNSGPPPGITITHSNYQVTVRNTSSESRILDLWVIFSVEGTGTTWYITVPPGQHRNRTFTADMPRGVGNVRIQSVRIVGWS